MRSSRKSAAAIKSVNEPYLLYAATLTILYRKQNFNIQLCRPVPSLQDLHWYLWGFTPLASISLQAATQSQTSCHRLVYRLYCPYDGVAKWIERSPPK